MLTKTESLGTKRKGKKAYFSERVEAEMARLYFEEDLPAWEIAKRFEAASPTGKLSPSAVRAICQRVRAKQLAATDEQPPDQLAA